MPKLTSSIHTTDRSRRLQAAAADAATAASLKQQQMQQPLDTSSQKSRTSCNEPNKTLTDFSIDSIIGPARLEKCDHISRVDASEPAGEKPERAADTAKALFHVRPEPRSEPENGLESNSNSDDLISLQNIMNKRERPKHFQCNWCPFKFSNNGQLRNHERIHTGERPFRCERPDCGRTFTRNEELTRHKLIHSGMRPHICRFCEKRFGRKDHLKKHERTHERKKSSRRSQASRQASAHPNRTRHELDMFVPMKLDYCSQHPSLPIEPCYRIPNSIVPATSQPQLFYGPQDPLSLDATRNGLLARQIVSLARVATTNTMTPSIPMMSASLEATQAIMTNASNAMQQLATNYLHSWFNAVGQQS